MPNLQHHYEPELRSTLATLSVYLCLSLKMIIKHFLTEKKFSLKQIKSTRFNYGSRNEQSDACYSDRFSIIQSARKFEKLSKSVPKIPCNIVNIIYYYYHSSTRVNQLKSLKKLSDPDANNTTLPTTLKSMSLNMYWTSHSQPSMPLVFLSTTVLRARCLDSLRENELS